VQGARDVGPGRGGGGDALRDGGACQQAGLRPHSPGEVRTLFWFLFVSIGVPAGLLWLLWYSIQGFAFRTDDQSYYPRNILS
jgi:hypothetical protein